MSYVGFTDTHLSMMIVEPKFEATRTAIQWALENYRKERRTTFALFESRQEVEKQMMRQQALTFELQKMNKALDDARAAAEEIVHRRGRIGAAGGGLGPVSCRGAGGGTPGHHAAADVGGDEGVAPRVHRAAAQRGDLLLVAVDRQRDCCIRGLAGLRAYPQRDQLDPLILGLGGGIRDQGLEILVEDLVFLVRQVLEAEKGGVEFFLCVELDAQVFDHIT